MFKISKRISLIVFIVLVFITLISNIYDLIHEALEFKKANENKARENLNALILWSKNEAKEELEFAKNLSKETYNQEKVTKIIIKNFKMMQTSVEGMRILTIYHPTEEDAELLFKVTSIIFKLNVDIILNLLYNESNITKHKTCFLFDKERFDAFEDFLFYLNTHLEKDFLQKDIDDFTIIKTGTYFAILIGYNRASTDLYLSEFLQDFICDLNHPKTISILKGMSKINLAADKFISFLNKELKRQTDDDLRKNFKEMIEQFPKKIKLNQKQIDQLNTIKNKLKECNNG